jgi:hypothetical protein
MTLLSLSVIRPSTLLLRIYRESKDAEEAAKERASHARQRILALSQGKKLETVSSRVTFYTKKGTKVDYQKMIDDHEIDIEKYTTHKESDPIMKITSKEKKGKNDGVSGSEDGTEQGTQISLFAGSDESPA